MGLSKKRKASDLEDDTKAIEEEDPGDQADEIGPGELTFEVRCPAIPSHKSGGKGQKRDIFGPETEDGGFPNLTTTYTITPGSIWGSLRQYRHFEIRRQKFSLGSIVYINRRSPVPPSPPPGSSEETLLDFDRANFWCAKVLEVRAVDTERVYLRVFWLYWPDELPMGRKPYHGAKEFIMSNAMDIIDALSVSGLAEVQQWNEDDDTQEDLGQRYFRQFLDITKLKPKSDAGLSEIKKHCVCREYYNPDKIMYQCSQPGCELWNHEECLIKAVLGKTYKRLVEESEPATNGTGPAPDTNNGALEKALFPKETLSDLKKGRKSTSTTKGLTPAKNYPPSTPKSTTKSKAKKREGEPWVGKFRATIAEEGQTEGKAVKATITDDRGQDPEVWTEEVECLKCGKVLQ